MKARGASKGKKAEKAVGNLPPALRKIFYRQKTDSPLYDAGLFLLLFAAFGGLAYIALSSTGPLLHYAAAHSAASVMEAMGFDVAVVPNSPHPHVKGATAGGVPFEAEIIDLCAGAIELAILFGIVVASRDKSLKHRLFGVAAGFAVFFLFNPIRIALTLSAVGSWALPLLHDVLFRLSLLIVIVGFYAVWSHATPSKRF